MKFCPNCGAQIQADASFCTKCGTKLSNTNVNNNQPINSNPNNIVNNNGTFATNNKKLSNKTIITIVVAVVVVLLAVFGWHKYQSMPARNPNNPLSHQTIVIQKVAGDPVYSPSSENFGSVFKRVAIQCYKKMGASSTTINDMQQVSNMDWYEFYHVGENRNAERALDENPVFKKHFMKEFNRSLDNNHTQYLLKLVPQRRLHEGQKIKVQLMLDDAFARKYGFDKTPLQIKVSQIKHVREFS